MNKTFLAFLVATAAAIPSIASAERWEPGTRFSSTGARSVAMFSDTARVTSVTPLLERVRSKPEECRTVIVERVESSRGVLANNGSNAAGVLVGGLVGGLLGNQVGGGSGKAIATAVGVVGGAMVGDHMSGSGEDDAHMRHVTEKEVTRCTPPKSVERVVGYDVTYQYMGRSYTTVMNNDPGRRVRLNVSVTPVE